MIGSSPGTAVIGDIELLTEARIRLFDLPPFSHPVITRDSVFCFGFAIDSQPLFLLWKCGKGSLLCHISIACDASELPRCSIGQGTVRAFPVILLPSGFEGCPHVVQGAEPAGIEAFVAQSSVEALGMPVLHWPAGLDVDQGRLSLFRPGQHPT